MSWRLGCSAVALLIFLAADARAQSVTSDSGEHGAVSFNHVIYCRIGRSAERQPRITAEIRDREVAATDHVHSNDHIESGWRGKFRDEDSGSRNLVRQFEI